MHSTYNLEIFLKGTKKGTRSGNAFLSENRTEVGTPFQYFETNEERERTPLKGTVAYLC